MIIGQRSAAKVAIGLLQPRQARNRSREERSRLFQSRGETENVTEEDEKWLYDKYGNVVLTPAGYLQYPTLKSSSGQVFRVGAGPVATRNPVSIFVNQNHSKSKLLQIEIERPFGIVFGENRRGHTTVADLVPGGRAERMGRIAKLNQRSQYPRIGDVVRVCTCTTILYQRGALLFGAQKPKRHINIFGCDGESFETVVNVLARGLVADGEVTLILERPE